MTNSEATAQVTFSHGSQQVYNFRCTDGTEGELLEILSGSGLGTAALGLTVVGMQLQCENEFEYLSIKDELGVIIYSTGGSGSETFQSSNQTVPGGRAIKLNYTLNVLTAAS